MTFIRLPRTGRFRSIKGRKYQIPDVSPGCGSPPSYQSLEDPAPTITTAPRGKGSTETSKGTNSLVRQEHSGIYNTYFRDDDDEGWEILALKMVPDPTARLYKKAPWTAVLEVKTTDIPRLMREGFFWSAENVVPEAGFMSSETRPAWIEFGFVHKRTWVLVDKSNPSPTWVGRLDVSTPSYEILPSFQVQSLTSTNVYEAIACNAVGDIIYDYNYRLPKRNFNCIYDNKPLQGWWPWPKEKEDFATSAGPGLSCGGEPSAYISIS